MSEHDRQHRLHVENRLQELRAKYGQEGECESLPPWLDSLEGYMASGAPKPGVVDKPHNVWREQIPAPVVSVADLDV